MSLPAHSRARRSAAAAGAALVFVSSVTVIGLAVDTLRAGPAQAAAGCVAGAGSGTFAAPAIGQPVTCNATANTTTYGEQSITLPLGATSVDVTVVGGGGAAGDRTGSGIGGAGGAGASITATLSTIGASTSSTAHVGVGASSASRGGGLSYFTVSGSPNSTGVAMVLAGGGGGGGGAASGATGGAGGAGFVSSSSLDGADGSSVTVSGATSAAGGGGSTTTSSGGVGATTTATGQAPFTGGTTDWSNGGIGGFFSTMTAGFGGSGWYGGGGGVASSSAGVGAGGGAASSYVSTSATNVVSAAVTSGAGSGGAQATTTWATNLNAGKPGAVSYTYRTVPVDLEGFGSSNPTSSITQSSSQTLTLNGLGFTAGTTVTVGGQPCTSPTPMGWSYMATNAQNDRRQVMTCTAPTLAAGTYDVVVAQGGSSATDTLVGGYVRASGGGGGGGGLTVTGVSPTFGYGGGGTTVTITGTGFTNGVAVSIGGPCATVTVQSPTSLSCVTSAAAPIRTGATSVVVGSAVGSTPFAFTPSSGAGSHTVTAISPTTAPGTGGTTVTLTGAGFTGTPWSTCAVGPAGR